MNRSHYTHGQLFDFAREDLLIDAKCAEDQAVNGPYSNNLNKESLLAYAKECRAKASGMDAVARNNYVASCIRHTLAFATPCPLPI